MTLNLKEHCQYPSDGSESDQASAAKAKNDVERKRVANEQVAKQG